MGSPLLEFGRRDCLRIKGKRPCAEPAIYRPFATLLLPADSSEPFSLSQRSEARLS